MSGAKAWWRASRRHKRSATGWLATRLLQVRGYDEHGCLGFADGVVTFHKAVLACASTSLQVCCTFPPLSSQRST